MRLSCPNCGAIYELPEDRLPEGGGHVQCTDCHTRWFARRPPAAAPGERPSEDEIIARLEARTPPRAAPAPGASGAPGASAETIPFPGPRRPQPEPQAQPQSQPQAQPQTQASPAAAAEPAQPGKVVPPQPAAQPTPLRPRPDRPTPAAAPGLPPAPRRRGGLGFALALALAAAAFGLHLGARPLAAQIPAAAPALSAYADQVEALRDGIESTLGPLRDRLFGNPA